MGLIDVPPGQTRHFDRVTFFDEPAWFPIGLLSVALAAKVPVVVFSLRLDYKSGKRLLDVRHISGENETEQLAEVVAYFEDRIRADSVAWHRWTDLPLFRVDLHPLPK
jgi:hypothetical protein